MDMGEIGITGEIGDPRQSHSAVCFTKENCDHCVAKLNSIETQGWGQYPPGAAPVIKGVRAMQRGDPSNALVQGDRGSHSPKPLLCLPQPPGDASAARGFAASFYSL